MNALLLLVPASLALAYAAHAPPLWVFFTAVLAIVPLAEWIRRATEQLARLAGPAVGGLLNVTFGNVAELVLGLFVLANGDTEVVKGQITGAIIGNGLLGLGLAVMVGTWGRDKLTFDRERAGSLGSLLMLSVIALLVPALFEYTERSVYSRANTEPLAEELSLGVSGVLIFVYGVNLVRTLAARKDVYEGAKDHAPAEWPLWKALAVLVAATAVTAVESELVSNALEATAARLRLTPFFLGVIVLAVVGNAAEYVSAVYFARRGDMGLVLLAVYAILALAFFFVTPD
jgi:Ca2+:H+ antiporter